MVDSVASPESLCKCCLNQNGLRDMWAGYISTDSGEFEIFGQMLTDCFTLPWAPPEDETLQELICDSCVERLRIAYNFKKEILETNELLIEVGKHTTFKNEAAADSIDEGTLPGEDNEAPKEEAEYYDEEWLTENLKQEPETEQYEEVEYLEEDVSNVAGSSVASDDQKSDYEPTKKKKKDRRYKNYTEAEMKIAIAAIKNKTLTVTRASDKYNIPQNTLRQRMGIDEKELLLLREKRETINRKQKQLTEEVKSLLTYTNATVYKIKNSHLFCAYCLVPFEDPEELRVHSRTKHSIERIKAIDEMLRINNKNEIVRVDIYNLHCTVCCLILTNWPDMFHHLQKCHHVEFSEAHSRVIPFILTKDNKCALCKENFLSFSHLDNHMNQHFQNFNCHECGEYFLSELRRKLHMKIHRVGQYPCLECGKVFSLEHYRMKHVRILHNRHATVKCMYCFVRFTSEYQRYLHIRSRHPDKTSTYICELCGEAFDWHPYYARHVKKMHDGEGKYHCRFCNKKFVLKRDKLSHEKSIHAAEKEIMTIQMRNLSNYMNAERELQAEAEFGAKRKKMMGKPKRHDGSDGKPTQEVMRKAKPKKIIRHYKSIQYH